jgi:hypothetical protein
MKLVCFALMLMLSRAYGYTEIEIANAELENTEWLLKPQGDRDFDTSQPMASFRGNVILDLDWVRYDDLLSRARLLHHWLKNPDQKLPIKNSENYFGLTVFNTGEAMYCLTGANFDYTNNALADGEMWRVLLNDSQAKAFYELILKKLPGTSMRNRVGMGGGLTTSSLPITGESICLIVQYTQEQHPRQMHYYFPDITYVNGLLSKVVDEGQPATRYLAHHEQSPPPLQWTVQARNFVPDSEAGH